MVLSPARWERLPALTQNRRPSCATCSTETRPSMWVSVTWHRHRPPERVVTGSHALHCRLPVRLGLSPRKLWARNRDPNADLSRRPGGTSPIGALSLVREKADQEHGDDFGIPLGSQCS